MTRRTPCRSCFLVRSGGDANILKWRWWVENHRNKLKVQTSTAFAAKCQCKPARCRPLLLGERAHVYVLEADHRVASGQFQGPYRGRTMTRDGTHATMAGPWAAMARLQGAKLGQALRACEALEEGEPGGRGTPRAQFARLP